ncbi:Oligosaccharide repeat unit polymerase Wzy; O-antigen ligase [hydrothermal vent metagenome]|uniref:Oligosaccharide repeat unit polymerase Wzy O-antigen ligase n=1 Tax=hydrothermal vent metagenome TaxID=652676 RepID=A0A1W1BXF9_9ZZZZ
MTKKHLFNFFLVWLVITPILAPFTQGTLIAPHEFKLYVSGVVLLLIVAWWFLNSGFEKHFRVLKSHVMWVSLLFICWAGLSIFWSLNTYLAIAQLQQWLIAFLVFFLVLNFVRNKNISEILSALFIAVVLVSILGIVQYLFDFDLIRQAVKPASTFGNKNIAIHFVVLTLPLGLGLLLNTKEKKQQFLYLIGLIISLSFLLLTQTRAGYLALLVQLLTLLLFVIFDIKFNQKKINFKKLGLIFTLFLVLFLVVSNKIKLVDRFNSIVKEFSLSKTGNSRINSWLNTGAMITDNPILGVGLGNWVIHYSLYHNKVVKGRLFDEKGQLRNIHNDYLTILSELGFIGFIVLLWLFYLVVIRLWKLLKIVNEYQYLVLGMTLSLIGFLVNAGFSFPLSMFLPAMVIMIYFAIIERLFLDIENCDKKQIKKITWQLSKRTSIILGLLFFALVIMALIDARNKIKAEDLYFQAEILERQGQWSKLEKIAFKSYQLNPNRLRISAYLAQAKQHLGKYQEAEKYFTQALSLQPFNINTLSFFARAMVDSKKYQKSKELYEKAIKIYPNWAKAHKNLGVLLYNYFKDIKGAKDHFKKALELNPNIDQAALLKKVVNSK